MIDFSRVCCSSALLFPCIKIISSLEVRSQFGVMNRKKIEEFGEVFFVMVFDSVGFGLSCLGFGGLGFFSDLF